MSCWHVTRLPRYLVRSTNEPFSIYGFCWNFLGFRLLKHWKICIAYRQWRSKFPERGKLNNQWLWWWHFSRLKTKLDNWKILSLRNKSLTDNFVNWILVWLFVFFFNDSRNFSYLEPYRQRILQFLGDFGFHFFYSLIKSTFLSVKGYSGYAVNKFIHGHA